MSRPVDSDEYAEFLAKEYLLEYIRTGGAAVKVGVGAPAVLARFTSRLQADAHNNDYLYASIDAATSKISMTDHILFALTRSLDLPQLTRSIAENAYRAADFPVATPGELDLRAVASHHGVDPGELHRSVRRRLEQALLGARALPRDLRLALFRLAQQHMGAGDVSTAEADAILCWLTGQPAAAGPLRTSGIRYRITRTSAHRLLVALPTVSAAAGHRGLILHLSIDELGHDRATRTPGAVAYTKSSRLDAYEVLRQIIDATDTLRHCLVVVTSPAELFDDPRRGPSAYQALAMRIVDDVEDRSVANPFGTVIHLS